MNPAHLPTSLLRDDPTSGEGHLGEPPQPGPARAAPVSGSMLSAVMGDTPLLCFRSTSSIWYVTFTCKVVCLVRNTCYGCVVVLVNVVVCVARVLRLGNEGVGCNVAIGRSGGRDEVGDV